LPFGQPAGPTCYFWTGDVTFVADGDTIDVDIHGDGNSTPAAIRFIGINAMGLRTYSSYPSAGPASATASTRPPASKR
jgi:endonuclease YncB( thermonuclease family)